MLVSLVSCVALVCVGAFSARMLWINAGIALVVFLFAEIRRARVRFRIVSLDDPSKFERISFASETQLHRKVIELQELLQAREWERDVTTQIARPIEEHPLIRELTESADLRKFSNVELYQRVLTIVAGFTRAQAAGVIFRTEAGSRITAYGVAGRRFEHHLRSLGEEFWGGAGSFGHRFSLVLPLSAIKSSESAVLWLGYAHGSQPSATERATAERLVKAVSEAVSKAHIIAKLDSRVEIAEVDKKNADRMLAHVSHDIRTPLANVKGILHLLSTPSADTSDNVSELTRVALQNCDELGVLVGDVIDFTRGQTGQLASRKVALDIEPLCKLIVSNFSVAAKQRGLSLRFASSGSVWINGDASHLKRVISNLVSNAIKYTNKGEISVQLETPVGAGLGRIVIADTGLGMGPEQLAQVFTPFVRFHADRADGIGLGLVIAKLFVEEHSGKIYVVSKPNTGTVFTIELPLQSALSQQPPLVSFNEDVSAPSVLLVDDDVDVGESLARLLRLGGCRVECVSAVSIAQEKVASGEFSVVITDLAMPGGGGRAVLNAAHAMGDLAPAIFVLTGDFNAESVSALKALGALDVFEKPVDHSVLLAEIRLVTARRLQDLKLQASGQ